MRDKSSTELFQIVAAGLGQSNYSMTSDALAELQERWHSGRTGNPAAHVSQRLSRVEEDLAAFKREHATNPWGKGYATRDDLEALRKSTRTADHGLLPDGNVDPAIVDRAVLDMRTNAENRAWQCLEDWHALEIKKPENAGNVYEVRILMPDGPGKTWHADLCVLYTNKRGVGKAGTSRVDALAHLASWCQAELAEVDESGKPSPYCGHDGPCGVGVPKCVQETVKL